MTPGVNPLYRDSRAYKQHEGAAVFTHISNTLADYIDTLPPIDPIEEGRVVLTGDALLIPESRIAFSTVSRHLSDSWKSFNNNYGELERICDIDSETLSRMHDGTSVGLGVADLDFVGYFAPAVAAVVVDQLQYDSLITSEQANGATLTDYADILNSHWFGHMMHDMARTSNGAYGTYGRGYEDYSLNAFVANLKLRLPYTEEKPLESSIETDKDGYGYVHVRATESLHKCLRSAARNAFTSESHGCPVARHAMTLPNTLVEDSIPIQKLLRSGALQPSNKKVSGGSTHYTQEFSAIDRALTQLAGQLIVYEDMYGLPHLTRNATSNEYQWVHREVEPRNFIVEPVR